MADQNSIFYKLGQAVKQEIATGTSDLSNKADLSGANFTGDVTIDGSLQVLGEQTVTKINQKDLDISDNFIGLNRGASELGTPNEKDIGLYFERGQNQSAAGFLFDETNDKFLLGFVGAGGLQVTTTTSDGDFVTSLTGDLADSMSAAIAEGDLNVSSSATNVTTANFDGSELAYTVIEVYVSHPTIDAASDGPWMDGHNSAAEFKTSLDALDFSVGGSLSVNVIKGTSPWNADHPVLVYINDGTNQFEITSSTVFNVATYDADLSLTSAATASVSGDATAANVTANTAPLKVASLEIDDATDGSLALGDFADFEAGLAAS